MQTIGYGPNIAKGIREHGPSQISVGEIDLRQMLGEKEVPPPLEPVKGVLY